MVKRSLDKNFTYVSLILLAIAFVILLVTLYPYRPMTFIIATPTPILSPVPTLPPVIISSPDLSLPLSSPASFSGKIDRSWVFEGTFPLELFDAFGSSLFLGTGSADRWLEETSYYTDFTATLEFSTNSQTGSLEFRNDNPSGLPKNSRTIRFPVIFSSPDTIPIKLFFHNLKKDPNLLDYKANDFEIFNIPRTSTPLMESIKLLISRHFSSDAKNFNLEKAVVKDGTATLTFSDPDHFSTGGSTRVGLFADMITKTAMQFPSVKNVKFIGPEYLFQP